MKIRRRVSCTPSPSGSKDARSAHRHRGWLSLSLVGLLVLCSGCTSWRDYLANGFKVGPNYCRPGAPVAEQWIDSTDTALDTRRTDDADWWRTFNDPVLDNLIQTAYQQNLTLRVAGLRVLEARAQRAIAAGELFPQSQQAFGAYTRTQLSKNGPSGASPNLSFDDWQLGTGLSWELDFWGRFRRSIEAADANLEASVENYDDALVILLAQVSQGYMSVRVAEQRLAYAKQNVEIQRGTLNLAEDRLRQGATTRSDVTQAMSNVAQTEATIPRLETTRRRAMNELSILLGMPPQNLDAMLAQSRGIPKTPAQAVVGVPAELLRRRPDIRRAERLVAAQSALIGVAESDLYPHFAISGSIYLDTTRFEDLFDADSVAGNVGPSFSWNILNYGRLVNNVRVQEARFQQLAVTYQNAVLQANAEAENAMVGFLNTQREVKWLTQSADSARETVDLVSQQYREGTVDFNRVFDVQTFLTQQQDQLAVALGAVNENLVRLYQVLGGGWQIRLNRQPAPMVAVAEPQPAPAPVAPVPAKNP